MKGRLIHLSTEAQGTGCRFKIWQVQHSGPGKDVWAVDNLFTGPHLTNKLTRNETGNSCSFCDLTADAFVSRHPQEEFCEPKGVIVLQANELEETYPVRRRIRNAPDRRMRNYDTDRDGCPVRGTRNVICDGIGMRSLETKEIQYLAGMSVLYFMRLGDCEPSRDGP